MNNIEMLAIEWHKSKQEAKAALVARKESRASLGPCLSDSGACYHDYEKEGNRETWCEVCKVQQDKHEHYHKAIIKQSKALRALNRAIKELINNTDHRTS